MHFKEDTRAWHPTAGSNIAALHAMTQAMAQTNALEQGDRRDRLDHHKGAAVLLVISLTGIKIINCTEIPQNQMDCNDL